MILQLLKYSRDNPLTNLLPAAVSVSNISTPGSDPYPVLGLQSFNITIEVQRAHASVQQNSLNTHYEKDVFCWNIDIKLRLFC